MASRAIIHREKTAAELRACLQSHAAEAAKELAEALEPEALGVGEDPGIEVPDMEAFQFLLRSRLDTCRQRLVAADEAHLRNLRGLRTLRRSRDAAVSDLRRLLASLRQGVDAVHGPGASAEILLVEGLTPRDPVVLHRLAARVANHLEEAPFPSPETALAGIDLQPARWVALLREPLLRLGRALETLTRKKREAVDTLLAKNAAKKEYDRLYASTTRMLQEFFRYVGMDEMAASIRPPRRKTSSTEEANDSETEEDAIREDLPGELSRPHLALVPSVFGSLSSGSLSSSSLSSSSLSSSSLSSSSLSSSSLSSGSLSSGSLAPNLQPRARDPDPDTHPTS